MKAGHGTAPYLAAKGKAAQDKQIRTVRHLFRTTYEVLQEASQMLRWAVQAVVFGGILSDVSWPSPSQHDGSRKQGWSTWTRCQMHASCLKQFAWSTCAPFPKWVKLSGLSAMLDVFWNETKIA